MSDLWMSDFCKITQSRHPLSIIKCLSPTALKIRLYLSDVHKIEKALKIRKYLSNVHKIEGAYVQCMNNHYAKFEY